MKTKSERSADGPSAIDRKLADLGVPDALRHELGNVVNGRHLEAALLYGSWARGDADVDSDLDVLLFEAIGGHGAVPDGQISLATYDRRQFGELSGTLFGFHLVRDGVILHDTGDQLAHALAAIQRPEQGSVIARVRSFTPVLDVSDADRRQYIEGLTKVGRYLLRTAMYALALDEGRPCFSVRELADRNRDPALVAVLSSHPAVQPAASHEVFQDLRGRLEAVVGTIAPNQYGTLHGLIEGSWESNRELSNFATLALASEGDELPYDELPRVTL